MRLIVLLTFAFLLCGRLIAEEDPSPALKTKVADEMTKAYQEIDALVAKFETWEEAAHKAGWGDDKVESEQKKAGWDGLLEQVKKLKAAGAAAK